MSLVNQLAIKNRLASKVMTITERKGLRLDTQCKGRLERYISNGIEHLIIYKLTNHPEKILVAEDNIVQFLECMERHAKSLGTFPKVGETAFKRAKNELSPLWPFC